MSLGVRHLWRFRRHASLAPRVSLLIPRELLHPVRSSPTAPGALASYSSSRCLPAELNERLRDGQCHNSETFERSPDTPGSTVNMATGPVADAPVVFSPQPFRSHISKGLLFFDQLSKLPICTEEISAPVVVKRPTKYSHHREINRDLQQTRKTLVQHNYHTRRQKELLASESGDWRGILRTLNKITPVYSWVLGSVQVIIPEESVHLLTEDRANNIWVIKSKTGCALELHYKDPESPQDNTFILLTGEKSEIDRAIQYFLDLCQRIKVTHLTGSAAEQLRSRGDLSTVWSQPNSIARHRYLSKSLDEIEKPEQWTMITFEHYIETLTQSQFRPPKPGQPQHPKRVALALLEAFHDPATESAMSPISFKLALRYITSWGDAFWGYATELVGLMMSAGFELDSEIYDLLARIDVRVNKIAHFRSLVEQMALNGYRPSLQTWIHFLHLVKDEGIRRCILDAMNRKGLLAHPSAMPDLAAVLVEHDVKRAIQNGLGFSSFVASQNELYGPEWLHWQSSNKVLDVLGSYGRFDDIERFLAYTFRSPSARPETDIALNIILTHCKNQRKLDTAISIVKRFERELEREAIRRAIRREEERQRDPARAEEDIGALKTSPITYHLLAEMAYRLKKPHMFGVLCRHSYLMSQTPRRITIRLFELATMEGYRRSPKRIRSFFSRLKIAGAHPYPKPGSPDKYSHERKESDKKLVLAMQNLLLWDYKEAHSIGQDQRLSDDEVQMAVEMWYRATFGDKKDGVDKLGNILERALEEDRKNRADSHAGKEIVLEPLSLKPVPLEEPPEMTSEMSWDAYWPLHDD